MASEQVDAPHPAAAPGSSATTQRGSSAPSYLLALLGAALAIIVVIIHVVDQGGFPGTKDPEYLQVAYWILEVAGIVCAGLLLARRSRPGWIVALGVAVGPLVGYILTRGPGLPDATDDIGNWGEPLGVLSLIVEGLLLLLALGVLARARTAERTVTHR